MSLPASRSVGFGLALGSLVGLGVGVASATLASGGRLASAVLPALALGLTLGLALGALTPPVANWARARSQPVPALLSAGTLAGLVVGVGAGAVAWSALDASLLVAGCWALGGGGVALALAGRHALASV